MKDIYKNPILYYILVPTVVALWPLFVSTVYLPNAERSLSIEMAQYTQARTIMDKIRDLDPGRLDFADSGLTAAEFDYAIAVDKVASSHRINYTISSKPIRTSSSGQKTQNAVVNLKDVDITKFARFLSAIQLRWANLQCEKVTLTKKKGLPDTWKIDLEFKYYY